MALQLAHVVDIAQRAVVGQLLGPHVLGREAEVLAVHQDHAGPPAGLDHLVTLARVHRHRLFHQHMLAGGGCGERHLAVQVVGAGDGYGIDQAAGQHIAIVGEGVRNAEAAVEGPDVLRVRRSRGTTRQRRPSRRQSPGPVESESRSAPRSTPE